MTREEIKNTPKIVDYVLSESLMAESKEKLHKRLDEICNLAIKELEQEPKADVLAKIKKIVAKWEEDSWTDNLSYECMKEVAGLVKESDG